MSQFDRYATMIDAHLKAMGQVEDAPRVKRVAEPLPWPAVVPMPPTTNHLFLNVAGRGRVKTADYKAWLSVAVPMLARWARPLEYPVSLEITINEPMPANADVSNRIKALEDAMVAAGILEDDSRKYVEAVTIRYVGGSKGVAVTIV